ncbi:MAG: sodium:proton antiporter [Micavibrio sp.]|nr:sodium:proton antiporter [Micavibrio sp.]|tara:strand:- start:724574 stop:725623 length:1050 start_codon:yes stop_codon:yes gene_type:complete
MADNVQSDIEERLENVTCPWNDARSGLSCLTSLTVNGATVTAIFEVPVSEGTHHEAFRQSLESEMGKTEGIESVQIIFTAERAPVEKQAPDPHGMNKNPKLTLPVKRIIAVASGKGGVGKSTVAANLAVALSQTGEKVGLLDADIYGPSVPTLMGLQGQKPDTNDEKKLIPLEAHGLKVISIGFLVDQDTPMIWRGPMVQTALYQLFRDVDWSGVDTLVVDMPPGTGDAQLTLAQKVDVDGAIIVSTPQDLALIDARKGIEMFRKTNVPVLGLIENMSLFTCPNCGHEEHIFAHGTLEEEAQKIGVPYLGALPLSKDIREASDAGKSALHINEKFNETYNFILKKLDGH